MAIRKAAAETPVPKPKKKQIPGVLTANKRRAAEAAKRRADAMDMLLSGMRPAAIAREMKVNRSTIHDYIERGLAELSEEANAITAKYKDMMMARHNKLLGSLWPKALKGDVEAARAALKVLEAQSRLMGLHAPVKIAATLPDGGALPTSSTYLLPTDPVMAAQVYMQLVAAKAST